MFGVIKNSGQKEEVPVSRRAGQASVQAAHAQDEGQQERVLEQVEQDEAQEHPDRVSEAAEAGQAVQLRERGSPPRVSRVLRGLVRLFTQLNLSLAKPQFLVG